MQVSCLSPLTVVSLFSGIGGSSLGFRQCGYKELLAIEIDNLTAQTFALNFPDVPLHHGDICKLDVSDILQKAKVKRGELDVLQGSPPCQGFSMLGKRDRADSRNYLFAEFVRVLDILKPKVFVLENVAGMIQGDMKSIFLRAMAALRSCGYTVKAQLLNAAYYGVPQSRCRVIVIGVRQDLGVEPSHPKPYSKAISVGRALQDIKPSENLPLSPLYLKYWQRCAYGEPMGKSFCDIKLDPRKPSPTIKKHAHFAIWDTPRWLAVNEYAVLSSFPESFRWIGRRSALIGMGNCVPPALSHAIALHIKQNLLSDTTKSDLVKHRY